MAILPDGAPTAPAAGPETPVMFDLDQPGHAEDERDVTHAPGASAEPPPISADDHRWFYALVGLLIGFAIALAVWIVWPKDNDQITTADVDRAIEQALAKPVEQAQASVAYDQAVESIVGIRAIRNTDSGNDDVDARDFVLVAQLAAVSRPSRTCESLPHRGVTALPILPSHK